MTAPEPVTPEQVDLANIQGGSCAYGSRYKQGVCGPALSAPGPGEEGEGPAGAALAASRAGAQRITTAGTWPGKTGPPLT